MSVWIKQDGSKITLNDEQATIEKAQDLGWTEQKAKPAAKEVEQPVKAKRAKKIES